MLRLTCSEPEQRAQMLVDGPVGSTENTLFHGVSAIMGTVGESWKVSFDRNDRDYSLLPIILLHKSAVALLYFLKSIY